MTAFGAIQAALTPFGYPVKPYVYDGAEVIYFVYNYEDNHGADFGDDDPGVDLTDVQVHLYLPITDPVTGDKTNFIRFQRIVRNALYGNGFTYPSVHVIREDNTKTWHLVFTCSYEEDVEIGEEEEHV